MNQGTAGRSRGGDALPARAGWGRSSASSCRRPRSIAPVARQTWGGRPPVRQQRTQLGAVARLLRSYFQSRCIGQISQCSCAVMIRTARRFVPSPSTPGPPTSEMLWKCTTSVSGSSSTCLRSASALNKGTPVACVASGERMPKPALERDGGAAPAAACTAQRMVAAHGVEGVDAVIDVDLVAAPAERLATADRHRRRHRRSCAPRRTS